MSRLIIDEAVTMKCVCGKTIHTWHETCECGMRHVPAASPWNYDMSAAPYEERIIALWDGAVWFVIRTQYGFYIDNYCDDCGGRIEPTAWATINIPEATDE